MTLKKNVSARNYETFQTPAASEAGDSSAGRSTHTQSTSGSDKSRWSAAQEAQRLASQGLWGDVYTPSATVTPTASTADDEESQYGDERHNYPTEPPPLYTPSDTTSNAPNSPMTARAELEPVGPTTPRIQQAPAPSTLPETIPHEDQEENLPGAYTSESPLLPRQAEDEVTTDYRSRWRSRCGKHRYSRCKRACWLTFAVILCLWVMLPALLNCDSRLRSRPGDLPDNDSDKVPIPSWPVPDREYRQHETSQSIDGTYALYDLLDLQTTSGSINVVIDIKPGSKPAVLRLASRSGSINIAVVPALLPALPSFSNSSSRPFISTLSTDGGSISGTLLHGNGGTTSISSISGSLTLSVYAIGVSAVDPVSSLSTTTRSGSQTIDVLSWPAEEVRAIEASHVTKGSGSINVRYPDRWAGEVHARCRGSGSVNVRGQGLKYIGGGRDVIAWRGQKEGLEARKVDVMEWGSGSVNFEC